MAQKTDRDKHTSTEEEDQRLKASLAGEAAG